jgi:hypothetical protein
MEPEGLLRDYKSALLVRILSQMNPINTFPPYFPKIYSIYD